MKKCLGDKNGYEEMWNKWVFKKQKKFVDSLLS